jgi:hypothetical protein
MESFQLSVFSKEKPGVSFRIPLADYRSPVAIDNPGVHAKEELICISRFSPLKTDN